MTNVSPRTPCALAREIPYGTAERFHSPVLLPFNPDATYEQKGSAPIQDIITALRWVRENIARFGGTLRYRNFHPCQVRGRA